MELSSRLPECQNARRERRRSRSFQFSVFRNIFTTAAQRIRRWRRLTQIFNPEHTGFKTKTDIGTGHENFEKHEKRRGHFAKSPSLFRGVGGGGVAKKVERAESAREPF